MRIIYLNILIILLISSCKSTEKDLEMEVISQMYQNVHPFLNDQQYIDTLADFDFSIEQFYTCLAYTGLNGTVGQANFLSISENSNNYNSSYYDVRANSTKEPNCD